MFCHLIHTHTLVSTVRSLQKHQHPDLCGSEPTSDDRRATRHSGATCVRFVQEPVPARVGHHEINYATPRHSAAYRALASERRMCGNADMRSCAACRISFLSIVRAVVRWSRRSVYSLILFTTLCDSRINHCSAPVGRFDCVHLYTYVQTFACTSIAVYRIACIAQYICGTSAT